MTETKTLAVTAQFLNNTIKDCNYLDETMHVDYQLRKMIEMRRQTAKDTLEIIERSK